MEGQGLILAGDTPGLAGRGCKGTVKLLKEGSQWRKSEPACGAEMLWGKV